MTAVSTITQHRTARIGRSPFLPSPQPQRYHRRSQGKWHLLLPLRRDLPGAPTKKTSAPCRSAAASFDTMLDRAVARDQTRRRTMQYLLLIYDEEKKWGTMLPGERGEITAAYRDFTSSIKNSGHLRAGDALQPTSTATSVRVRDGKTLATDGPFAETREQLGGYYIVEAKDLDAAIAIAARIPSARLGSIEVRPIWVYEEYAAGVAV